MALRLQICALVAAATLGVQVSAFPMFYNDRIGGCEIPTQAFGDHMPPVANPDVVISIADPDGIPVTTFVPGVDYTVSMDAYALTTHAWVHSTDGIPIVLDVGAIADCGEAWFALEAAATHSYLWTAPATTECVSFSAAQATGPMDSYNTGTAEFCPETVAAFTPTSAPTAAVPAPVSAPPVATIPAIIPAPEIPPVFAVAPVPVATAPELVVVAPAPVIVTAAAPALVAVPAAAPAPAVPPPPVAGIAPAPDVADTTVAPLTPVDATGGVTDPATAASQDSSAVSLAALAAAGAALAVALFV